MADDKKKDVLQPVDDTVRRLAKNLIRTARFAALATLDLGDGAPFVSRVSLATAIDGAPAFLISRLSGHFTNLEGDRRCSLLIGEPGKGDPLAHPRITLVGRAEPLPEGEERDRLKARYLRRHPKAALYAEFPDFAFWRFATARASLNGGFGKAYALNSADIETSNGDLRSLADIEEDAITHMNADHAEAVERCATLAGAKHTGWRLSAIDPEGLDLSSGDEVVRLWFDTPLASAADLRPTLVAIARKS
jgi:putative heme iron utilization protein